MQKKQEGYSKSLKGNPQVRSKNIDIWSSRQHLMIPMIFSVIPMIFSVISRPVGQGTEKSAREKTLSVRK